MKAIVLVGGKGTRLQPLTYSLPKPMVPVMNRPFLEHMIEWLRANGVDELILTTGYLPQLIAEHFGDGAGWGVRLTYVEEKEPLGTGGAIKNCESLLGEPFLAVNGDILTDLDLGGMRELHRGQGALVTVAAARVDDPTPYGMLETAPDGRVRRWVEKPRREEVTSPHVNVGVFLFSPEALAMMPSGPFNLEREFLTPIISQGQPVYGFRTECYWIDIGTAAKYRQAHLDVLSKRIGVRMPGREREPEVWVGERVVRGAGVRLVPPVVIGNGVRLGAGAVIGPHTVLADGARVGPGALVSGSVLWPKAMVGRGARVVDCVVGSGCRIGEQAVHECETLGPEPGEEERTGRCK